MCVCARACVSLPVVPLPVPITFPPCRQADARNKHGRTPLHCAASQGHVEVVLLLCKRFGVPVNVPTNLGWMPLHHAVLHGHLGVAAALVNECGADIHGLDGIRNTPLHYAFEWGQAACALLLLCCGADPFARNAVSVCECACVRD